MSNLPWFRYQIGDPTTNLDGSICTLESGAMALDFTTGGAVRVWGGQLIPYCGKTPTEISREGTGLRNVELAWAHWGQNLDVRDGPFEEVVRVLRGGDGVIAQGWYDALPSGDRCSSTFERGHAFYVHPWFTDDGTMVYKGDPLCKQYEYIRLTSLRAYMEQLARRERNDENRLFFARAPKHALPDTDTEDSMPALVVTKMKAASGVATTKAGPKHAAVQIADREYFFMAPGTRKRVVAQGVLVPPLDHNPGNRSDVWVVGDEAAVFLKMDVDFTPD
jgi:hypothetical protein